MKLLNLQANFNKINFYNSKFYDTTCRKVFYTFFVILKQGEKMLLLIIGMGALGYASLKFKKWYEESKEGNAYWTNNHFCNVK